MADDSIKKKASVVLENQRKLQKCPGPHNFKIKDGSLLSDICECSNCGGTTQVVYANWYTAGLKQGECNMMYIEEDIIHLCSWLAEITGALNSADKTGIVSRSLIREYLPALSEETCTMVKDVLDIEVIIEEEEVDDEED